jgi:hypothetical protein
MRIHVALTYFRVIISFVIISLQRKARTGRLEFLDLQDPQVRPPVMEPEQRIVIGTQAFRESRGSPRLRPCDYLLTFMLGISVPAASVGP